MGKALLYVLKRCILASLVFVTVWGVAWFALYGATAALYAVRTGGAVSLAATVLMMAATALVWAYAASIDYSTPKSREIRARYANRRR